LHEGDGGVDLGLPRGAGVLVGAAGAGVDLAGVRGGGADALEVCVGWYVGWCLHCMIVCCMYAGMLDVVCCMLYAQMLYAQACFRCALPMSMRRMYSPRRPRDQIDQRDRELNSATDLTDRTARRTLPERLIRRKSEVQEVRSTSTRDFVMAVVSG
jgi:hypothetical protein